MSIHEFDHSPPVLLFDGYCNLCNSVVQELIKRDTLAHFKFASLQSEPGSELLHQYDLDPDSIDTVVLVTKGRISIKSEAVLDVFQMLGRPYRLTAMFRLIPLRLRDAIYDWIARNRLSWFGKKQTCMVPTKELHNRFLD